MGFITRGYIMEHIENMHADLKLAKENPGWFLNMRCKTGCKFRTVTILHIKEKTGKFVWLFIMEVSTHLHNVAGIKCQVFLCRPSCTEVLEALRRWQLYQTTKLGAEAASFFIFLEQKLSWKMDDKCYWHQSKIQHLAYIIGIVSHLTSELRSFLTFL